jgi:hypothetical protein
MVLFWILVDVMYIASDYYHSVGGFFVTHPIEFSTSIFLVFLILVFLNARELFFHLKKINKKLLLPLFLIFIFGFWLRNSTYKYGALYDGFIYQSSAKIMLINNIQAWSCGIGNIVSCRLYNQHLAPTGYPYLIMILYSLFGVYDIYAMMLSGFLGSLTIILVFLISYFLFKDGKIALLSSLIFALVPMDIVLSSTAAVRPTSLFFIGLTMFFFIIGLESKSIKLWALVLMTWSISINIKQENSLLLLPMIYFIMVNPEKTSDLFSLIKKNYKSVLLLLLIFFLSLIPVEHWIIFADHGPQLFRISNFPSASGILLSSFFGSSLIKGLYNPIVSFFFFLSILFLFSKPERKSIRFLWIWFTGYFFLYSLLQCPNSQHNMCLDFIRFLQHLNITYAILSAYAFLKFFGLKHVKQNIVIVMFFFTHCFNKFHHIEIFRNGFFIAFRRQIK